MFFAPMILTATKSRGVDLVLDLLPWTVLLASLSTIATLGSLIEIQHRDLLESSLITNASSFTRHLVYVLAYSYAPAPPRTSCATPMYMQSGAQMGKVVLSVGAGGPGHVVPRPRCRTAEIRLKPDAS